MDVIYKKDILSVRFNGHAMYMKLIFFYLFIDVRYVNSKLMDPF